MKNFTRKSHVLSGLWLGTLCGVILDVFRFHTSGFVICICMFVGLFISGVIDEIIFLKEHISKLNKLTDKK